MFTRTFLTRYSIIVLLLLLTLGSAVQTFACVPKPGASPDYTLEDHIDNAPLVFVGTVVGGTIARNWFLADAEIEVEMYLKGEGLAVVTIVGFGEPGGCF